jgi:hypothetical protein
VIKLEYAHFSQLKKKDFWFINVVNLFYSALKRTSILNAIWGVYHWTNDIQHTIKPTVYQRAPLLKLGSDRES